MRLVTNSVAPTQVRETDSAYIIEDVPFLKPMRLAGGYVPRANIEETAPAWSHVPATLNHPRNEKGEPIPAHRKPETHIGEVRNPEFDGQHVRAGEIRVNKSALQSADATKVKQALENGDPIEVSSQYVPQDLPAGEYDGEHRANVEKIVRPDSVAILPEKSGQCSIEDGCGINPEMVANADVTLTANDPKGEDMRGNQRSSVRTPDYSGTENADWSEVSKSFENFRDGYYSNTDADRPDDAPSDVSDAPSEMRNWIASKTLLGDAEADSVDDLLVLPVVNPSTDNLNRNALIAVKGGRGAQAVKGISDSTEQNAIEKANSLLESEFGMDVSGNSLIDSIKQAANALGLNVSHAADGGGNPPADGNSSMKREDKIEYIVANSALSEESLSERCDDGVDAIYDDVRSNAKGEVGEGTGGDARDLIQQLIDAGMTQEEIGNQTDRSADTIGAILNGEIENPPESLVEQLREIDTNMSDNEGDNPTSNDDEQVVELTESELDDLIAEKAQEIVANQKEESQKEELATEIVANSAEYEDKDEVLDDLPTQEALELKRDSLETGGGFPATGQATANVGEDEIDVTPGVFE